MKLFRLFKKKPINTTDTTHSDERLSDGLRRKTTTTVVTERLRTLPEQAKIDAMQSFLRIVANEDIDPLFLAVFTTAQELGYNLQADPYTLLHKLNNVQ